jgi:hypothetical protein
MRRPRRTGSPSRTHPFAAALFVPLGPLDETALRATFTVLSMACYVVVLLVTARRLGLTRSQVWAVGSGGAGGLHEHPAGVPVPGLGDRPLHPGADRGVLAGQGPTNEPIVLPVNRCQSLISTARANAVNVDTPRRQPSRRTTGVNSLSAANALVAASSRSRRAFTVRTAS